MLDYKTLEQLVETPLFVSFDLTNLTREFRTHLDYSKKTINHHAIRIELTGSSQFPDAQASIELI